VARAGADRLNPISVIVNRGPWCVHQSAGLTDRSPPIRISMGRSCVARGEGDVGHWTALVRCIDAATWTSRIQSGEPCGAAIENPTLPLRTPAISSTVGTMSTLEPMACSRTVRAVLRVGHDEGRAPRLPAVDGAIHFFVIHPMQAHRGRAAEVVLALPRARSRQRSTSTTSSRRWRPRVMAGYARAIAPKSMRVTTISSLDLGLRRHAC
jgi:hypothetical protein